MKYSIFRLNIILRLALIVLLGYAIVFILTQTHFWLVSFWLILLSFILFIELLRYTEKSHKEMENLVVAIRQGDFSNIYRQQSFRSGNMLSHVFSELLSTFQHLRQEKESHHLYLQNMVEQVNIGLLCFNRQGSIQLINQAAKKLCSKPYLKHLKDLAEVDAELYFTISKIRAGEKVLVKILLNQQLMQLSVQATEFKMLNEYYKLVSLQDIKNELEENEIESWQKLIRVLTHEIMNSVIPIANLSALVNQMLIFQENDQISMQDLTSDDLVDLHESLNTIEERSNGLINFVKAYRSLTQITKPQFRQVLVSQILNRVITLLKPKLLGKNIHLSWQVTPEDISLKADLELVEQVMINLVNNAIEALEEQEQAEIVLKAFRKPDNEVVIQVTDNGPGIEEDVADQIFIPFFTTKRDGSGIGLSLSRQIMRLHKGSIDMQSQKGGGTVFSLYF